METAKQTPEAQTQLPLWRVVVTKFRKSGGGDKVYYTHAAKSGQARYATARRFNKDYGFDPLAYVPMEEPEKQ